MNFQLQLSWAQNSVAPRTPSTNNTNMALISQPSRVFPIYSVIGVPSSSSKTSLFPSTNYTRRSNRSLKISASLSDSSAESSSPPKSLDSSQSTSEDESAVADPLKLAFSKAKLYKKSIKANSVPEQDRTDDPIPESGESGEASENGDVGANTKGVPFSVKLALEKAREYKKNKGVVEIEGSRKNIGEEEKGPGTEETNSGNSRDGFVEGKVSKKGGLTVSSIDFVGLGFSDKKKSKGLPAGLVPVVDTFPGGKSPEVEIIVGDTSKFGPATTSRPEPVVQDDSDLYKPKVSTWGVFPRPSNISKTFGGGRVIHPGEALETAEDKAAKEAHTRQLIADYKIKMGITVDARLKKDCEKALKDGDQLMDTGKLKEALPYYEKVMEDLPFQSELHGLAALQWSICQDSLNRPNEARIMYEKLQSHSNVQVSKRARHFMFSFQAMEMMKVKNSSLAPKTGYQNYFEAFVKDGNTYPLRRGGVEEEDGQFSQAFPYIIFLVCPIFVVLYMAVQKGMP